MQDRIPIARTNFTRMLIAANRFDVDEFKDWAFCPGMLFGSPDKWWGDHGRRDFPHEGLDFCLYLDRYGQIQQLSHRTRIPVMRTGLVVAMFTDYLGQAIIIEHEDAHSDTGKLLSVYAHTRPAAGIQPGVNVEAGDLIATIADTRRSKANILPHLHFSLGLPSPGLNYQPFVWNLMRDPDRIVLLNPIDTIDWPCKVLDARHSHCLEL